MILHAKHMHPFNRLIEAMIIWTNAFFWLLTWQACVWEYAVSDAFQSGLEIKTVTFCSEDVSIILWKRIKSPDYVYPSVTLRLQLSWAAQEEKLPTFLSGLKGKKANALHGRVIEEQENSCEHRIIIKKDRIIKWYGRWTERKNVWDFRGYRYGLCRSFMCVSSAFLAATRNKKSLVICK